MPKEFIAIVMFLVIGLVFVLLIYYRYRSRSEMQQTIRVALEKGDSLTPELLDRIVDPKQNGSRDLRRGMISVALGMGTAMFGFFVDEDDAVRPLIGIAMFPLMVGIAYLLMWRFGDGEK